MEGGPQARLLPSSWSSGTPTPHLAQHTHPGAHKALSAAPISQPGAEFHQLSTCAARRGSLGRRSFHRGGHPARPLFRGPCTRGCSPFHTGVLLGPATWADSMASPHTGLDARRPMAEAVPGPRPGLPTVARHCPGVRHGWLHGLARGTHRNARPGASSPPRTPNAMACRPGGDKGASSDAPGRPGAPVSPLASGLGDALLPLTMVPSRSQSTCVRAAGWSSLPSGTAREGGAVCAVCPC